MMQKQTDEFIAGFIFNKAEETIVKSGLSSESIEFSVTIPKIWFGFGTYNPHWPLTEKQFESLSSMKEIIIKAIIQLTNSKYQITVATIDENQYLKFNFSLNKPKKMTVKEIEKALGYKIEIVSGD